MFLERVVEMERETSSMAVLVIKILYSKEYYISVSRLAEAWEDNITLIQGRGETVLITTCILQFWEDDIKRKYENYFRDINRWGDEKLSFHGVIYYCMICCMRNMTLQKKRGKLKWTV